MHKSEKGLTIVEVLVALAIISLVFVIFARLFQNFASKEGLKQSTNVLVSEITDVLSDVKDGVYYSQEDTECTYNATTNVFAYATSAGAKPGQNNKCIFLGKAILLGLSPATVGPDSQGATDYYIYTLVGPGYDNTLRINFDQFDLDLFKNDTAPVFDSTIKKSLSSRTVVTESYIWHDDNSDGVVDRSSEIAYIDGFAIVNASFGSTVNTVGGTRGGSRTLKLLPIYPCTDWNDKDRVRPSAADFRTRTQDNDSTSDCATASNKLYYHSNHDPSKNQIARGAIIVCLLGTSGQTYVRVGSNASVISAEAERDPTTVATKCS